MTDRIIELARLSGAASSDDGATTRFRIEGRDGAHVDIACDVADLERIVHYMVELGRLAAAAQEAATPHRFGHSDRVVANPIDISDVGLMREVDSDRAMLVLRMHGFDLGFTVEPADLKALHGEIERILPGHVLHPDDHHHHHDHDH